MRNRVVNLKSVRGQVRFSPESYNAAERRLRVRFYSGAAVLRQGFWDDEPYELAFSLDPEHVRLNRFNNGANILDNHTRYGSVQDTVLGTVEKAWVASDGGYADVRFSARDSLAPLLQDIEDGILRNFSMGAAIYKAKDVTQKGDKLRKVLAIDWEPLELSLVGVPADPGAQALGHTETYQCLFIGASAPQEDRMKIKVRLLATGEILEILEQDFDNALHAKLTEAEVQFLATLAAGGTAAAAPAATPAGGTVVPMRREPATEARARVDAMLAEEEAYAAEVTRLGQHYGRDKHWIQAHISLGLSVDEVRRRASEARASEAPRILPPSGAGGSYGHVQMGEDRESLPWHRDRMSEALAARAMGGACPEAASQYARHSFAELAFELLTRRGELRGRVPLNPRHDGQELITLGLNTTSDFALLLGNSLNKSLLEMYQLASPTFRRLAKQKNFRDFRSHKFLRAGDFPVPLQVGENGEYLRGTFGENQEQVTLVKYGRILGLSLEALVNDDMGAFNDLATMAGRRAADFENATFFAICILAGSGLGPNLSDTVAVYNAAHGNIAATGALSLTVLSSIREKMMLQTTIDGLKMNVVPSLLLVPPASLTLAEQLLLPGSGFTGGSTTVADINPFAGRLTPISDANISGTRVYGFADPNANPQYIYGGLEGQTGPRTEVRNGFEIDGVEFKLALYFGCGAIDYRFGVTAAGA